MERPKIGIVAAPNTIEIQRQEVRDRLEEYVMHDVVLATISELELEREGINLPQAHLAFRCIAEHMLENSFIDREEKIADEILQKIKTEAKKPGQEQGEQKKNPDLWLMSATGQFVLLFLRQLVHTKPKALYGPPMEEQRQIREDLPEELKQYLAANPLPSTPPKTKAEQMVEFTQAFFQQDDELLKETMKMAGILLGELKQRNEFILPTPYPPITQIPRNEVLRNQKTGHRFHETWNQYFLGTNPDNEGRPRTDFAVTSEDYRFYGLETQEEQERFVRDIEAANRERFPICALFDPTKAIEEAKQDSLSTPQLRTAIEAGGYVFGTIDAELAYGQYGWDEKENPYVSAVGSPFTFSDGDRDVPCLYLSGRERWLDANWLDDVWDRRDRLLVLRRASEENLAT